MFKYLYRAISSSVVFNFFKKRKKERKTSLKHLNDSSAGYLNPGSQKWAS